MTLVAFDFDGTLADSELIDRLARRHGVGDAVAAVTRRAMDGELAFGESLRERAALLEGLPAAEAEAVYADTRLRPGVGDLLGALEAAGASTAILTGGFVPGVEAALAHEGVSVDAIRGNRLLVADGRLTGAVEGPLIEDPKDACLRELAVELDASLEETIAVGDGANDRPMLDVAGLAVGYDPKPAVVPHCDRIVESVEALEDVLRAAGALPGPDGRDRVQG